MARILTPDRKIKKQWAIILAGVGMTQESICKRLDVPCRTVAHWLEGEKIVADVAFILAKNGAICHNSGAICHNFRDGLPPNPVPQLFVGKAEDMDFLGDKTVDIIITSPPYNLGQEKWPMGGNGRTPREAGIGQRQAS